MSKGFGLLKIRRTVRRIGVNLQRVLEVEYFLILIVEIAVIVLNNIFRIKLSFKFVETCIFMVLCTVFGQILRKLRLRKN